MYCIAMPLTMNIAFMSPYIVGSLVCPVEIRRSSKQDFNCRDTPHPTNYRPAKLHIGASRPPVAVPRQVEGSVNPQGLHDSIGPGSALPLTAEEASSFVVHSEFTSV